MADGFEGLSNILNRLKQLATDTSHIEKPLRTAGAYMLGSIEKNFQEQGRPKKWTPLAPRTLQMRRKGRRKKGSPKILIDTAAMKNSMSMKLVESNTEVLVGTNKVQARRQHFGYAGGKGRGRSATKARPFVMFQDEDYDFIGRIFRRHVERV